MAEKAKKNNKNLIIGICASILIIAVIVVAAIFATKGTNTLNDAYFVSTDTRYVLTEEGDGDGFEGTEYVPIKTHLVYESSNDKVTSAVNYVEFENESIAKAALQALEEELKEYDLNKDLGIESMSTNGKYLVITIAKDQYEGTTLSEIKTFYESDINIEDYEDLETEEIEEDTEEE